MARREGVWHKLLCRGSGCGAVFHDPDKRNSLLEGLEVFLERDRGMAPLAGLS